MFPPSRPRGWGDDGPRPGVLKTFLDSWRQSSPGGSFDHESNARWMRLFAREGLKRTCARGRDLDPAREAGLANYHAD